MDENADTSHQEVQSSTEAPQPEYKELKESASEIDGSNLAEDFNQFFISAQHSVLFGMSVCDMC